MFWSTSSNHFGICLVVSNNNSIVANYIKDNELGGVIVNMEAQFNVITDNQIKKTMVV
jgi:hypothetical protein